MVDKGVRCAWCGKAYVGEPGKLWGTCCVCRPIIDLAYEPEVKKEASIDKAKSKKEG
jgi:hypothetical protein